MNSQFKCLLYCGYIFLFADFALAQNGVQILQFPKNMQLIPREISSNKGNYTITGNLRANSAITNLRLNILRGDSLILEKNLPVIYTLDSFHFTIPIEIKAELIDYQIILHGKKNNVYEQLGKAERVVSGDVIVVNGQSNCIGSIEPDDEHPFLRSYTAQFGWNRIDYTQPGKWPPHVAYNIIKEQKVPVALFNEAIGGVTQNVFLKRYNASIPNNYQDLLVRLDAAEVKHRVHAFIWWQGESDGWETSTQTFKRDFNELYADWRRDYPTARIFFFQIRYRSCTHTQPNIMEAQRQLADEINQLDIMSTNNALSDGCHFSYKNGYDSLGNRMYRLLAARLYNGALRNVEAPNIDKIWFSGRHEVTIQLKKVSGRLKVIGNPWSDFFCHGSNVQVQSGKVDGNYIKLTLTDTVGVSSISYLSHLEDRHDWIINDMGVGILSFFQVPITAAPLSDTTKLHETWIVQPTFSQDYFKILLPETYKNSVITVFDNIGRVVFHENTNLSDFTLNASNWVHGIYFIGISADNIRQRMVKIVKTK
jgi:hypothetical protein